MVKNSYPGVVILPSGQVVAEDGSPSTQPPPAASDGRIPGIDGMLDQVAAAVARQAAPVIRTELLPVVLADRELQRTVGSAAGKAFAQAVWPWLALGSVSLASLAAMYAWHRIEKSRDGASARR